MWRCVMWVNASRLFERAYCLHFEGSNQARSLHIRSKHRATIHPTTLCRIPEQGNPQLYRCAKLRVLYVLLHPSEACLLSCNRKSWQKKGLRSAHTVYLCVLCGSENKQRLFHYTALTNWFL